MQEASIHTTSSKPDFSLHKTDVSHFLLAGSPLIRDLGPETSAVANSFLQVNRDGTGPTGSVQVLHREGPILAGEQSRMR